MTQLKGIANARGCREGWVQGELFLAALDQRKSMQTNATPKKYDLWCEQDGHRMCAEIKFCGDDYSPKMKNLVLADAEKIRKAPSTHERFLILIIDIQKKQTDLGKWLRDPREELGQEVHPELPLASSRIAVRIWRV
jgi:hypothetical protein